MKIKLNSDQEVVNTIREGLKRTGGTDRGCPAAHVLRAYWLDEPEVTAPPFSIF